MNCRLQFIAETTLDVYTILKLARSVIYMAVNILYINEDIINWNHFKKSMYYQIIHSKCTLLVITSI